MLAVVELHKLLGDDGLETVQGVRKRLEDSLLEGGEGTREAKRLTDALGKHFYSDYL